MFNSVSVSQLSMKMQQNKSLTIFAEFISFQSTDLFLHITLKLETDWKLL